MLHVHAGRFPRGELTALAFIAEMRASVAFLALPVVAALHGAGAQGAPPTCAPARTALVLSGGAAKGFAHVGVLEVLDSMGVKPDLIVGTSVGALIGSLYASGYSAAQVDAILHSLPFENIVRTYDPAVSTSIGLLKPLAVWERGNTGYRLQTGAAQAGKVNALIEAVTLRGNLLARGNFDSLPIPFRAVATNLVSGRPVVLASGDLGRAVRASVALPLVFQPVREDSTWLSDGGLSANTPVSIARALGAERVWVSRLPWAPPDPNTFDDPLALSETLIGTLFKDDTTSPGPADVSVVSPTYDFDQLDFRRSTADSLTRIGHRAASTAFRDAACVRPLNSAEPRPPAVLPAVAGNVTSMGRAPDERAVLGGIGVTPGQPIDLERTARGLVALGDVERIQAVWLDPHGSSTEVTFHPDIEPAPRRVVGMGGAFDQFMSGRLWIGGVDRRVFNRNAEGTVVARFGAYEQDLMGFVRAHADLFGGHRPVSVGSRLTHESVRLFTDTGELPNAETQEGEVFAGLRDDPEVGAWRFQFLVDTRLWREPGRDTRGSIGLRAAMLRARNTYEMGSTVEAVVLTDYQRVAADLSRTFTFPTAEFRFRMRAGWGHRLPVQQAFTLGGTDGFAGLRIGDLRGSQELFGTVRLRRRIAPQLRVTVEAMAGAMGEGDGYLVRRDSTYFGELYGGVRAGLEATTPIGPIRVEEGFANTGSRALLVRVGYWF